jgi:glutamate N-acetyltransferase / amino-acid N-acetyltransferase
MAVGKEKKSQLLPVVGVRLGVAKANIKKADRRDLVILEISPRSSIAGVFTRNAFCAAPVHIAKKNLDQHKSEQPCYFLINTGNANAGTGDIGMRDAQTCCDALAQLTGVHQHNVFPFSTGVIGEKLPVEKIINGLPEALQALSDHDWEGAGYGIMTTDTRIKAFSKTIHVEGEFITLTGICKGAGMIKPDMATMLAFIATDAKIEKSLLHTCLVEAVNKSFNRITIDGDTSTNDACMLVATGKSNLIVSEDNKQVMDVFKIALTSLCESLAQAIVRDGEGATKFITIKVEKAASQQEALDVGYTVAHSPLVKTALFASDPNWGRILAAVGRAGVDQLNVSKINIYLNDVCIVEGGCRASDYTEQAGQAVIEREDILIRIVLNRGDIDETVWTTDLSYDYVKINAEYRT